MDKKIIVIDFTYFF